MPERGAAGSEDLVRRDAEALAGALPPLMLEAERVAQTVAAGVHGRRRAGPGETFWQHRPYSFGDPVATIDWRQSARTASRLYVRQNEWEAAAAVWVWRDRSRSLDYASSPKGPTKRRRADVLATALAILLSEAGERIGLAGARCFHGRGAPSRFLEALAVDAFADQESSPPEFPVAAHSRVIFLSDFFSDFDAIAAAATRCARIGAAGVFLQILDPAEELFPFAGRTEFQDVETADRLIFGDAGSVRAAYGREFARHRAELEGLARRLQWIFLAHRTDAPANVPLLSLFMALADQRKRSW